VSVPERAATADSPSGSSIDSRVFPVEGAVRRQGLGGTRHRLPRDGKSMRANLVERGIDVLTLMVQFDEPLDPKEVARDILKNAKNRDYGTVVVGRHTATLTYYSTLLAAHAAARQGDNKAAADLFQRRGPGRKRLSRRCALRVEALPRRGIRLRKGSTARLLRSPIRRASDRGLLRPRQRQERRPDLARGGPSLTTEGPGRTRSG
jgi:hypothetical protein